MAMACVCPASSLWGARVRIADAFSPARKNASRPLVVEAKKTIEGKVVCASNDKTVSVEVTRIVVDPKSKKRLRRSKKYHAHDPGNDCKIGDFVGLSMCRPYSKTKKFIVAEVNGKVKLPTFQSEAQTSEDPTAAVVA